MGVKNPHKLLEKVLRDAGGRPSRVNTARGRRTGIVDWHLPDGYVFRLDDDLPAVKCMHEAGRLRKRYGIETGWTPGDHRSGKPVLDLERLTASQHAKDRLALMQSQAKVTFEDILLALRAPERVTWSEIHDSWIWVRDELAIPVSFDDSGFGTIRTVLWASQELFEQNPRPESRTA